ncbi:hypothetical protein D3C72_1691050 [compost metagenome]
MFQPCSSFSAIISTAMMASSTSRPSAMISEPSEMRCRSMPSRYMARKVIASTSGMDSATTMPLRTPRLRKHTASTITTASISTFMNSPTAFFTTCGWSDTEWICMPTGSLFCTSCISSCRLLPSFSTSPPCFMLMARPSAGLPSKRMPNDGGVTN